MAGMAWWRRPGSPARRRRSPVRQTNCAHPGALSFSQAHKNEGTKPYITQTQTQAAEHDTRAEADRTRANTERDTPAETDRKRGYRDAAEPQQYTHMLAGGGTFVPTGECARQLIREPSQRQHLDH